MDYLSIQPDEAALGTSCTHVNSRDFWYEQLSSTDMENGFPKAPEEARPEEKTILKRLIFSSSTTFSIT